MNAASTEKITYLTYVLLPLLQIHSLEHNFVDGIVFYLKMNSTSIATSSCYLWSMKDLGHDLAIILAT